MSDELIDVLDGNAQGTGKSLPKRVVHQKELWHGGAHVWIYNHDTILLQHRTANKDIYPNTWDISAAGHISAGESPVQAAVRETHEELGLSLRQEELEFVGLTRTVQHIPTTGWIHKVFDYNYIVSCDLDLHKVRLQAEEVDEVRWFSINDLITDLHDVVKSQKYSPRPFYMYDMIIQAIRSKKA